MVFKLVFSVITDRESIPTSVIESGFDRNRAHEPSRELVTSINNDSGGLGSHDAVYGVAGTSLVDQTYADPKIQLHRRTP